MISEELEDLIQKYVLGNLTESEAEALSSHLEREDAHDARRKLRLALKADAYLQEAAAEMSDTAIYAKNALSRERAGWLLGGLAAAMVVGVCTWYFGQGATTTEDDLRVATVHRIEGAAQANGQGILLNDEPLLAEDRITMEEGLIELVFRDSGVHAIGTAPLSITLQSSEKVFLHRGDLKLHVPPQGIGFVVETEERKITDLGTRFVVSAGKAESRVLVLDGLVSIGKKTGLNRHYMVEGEAATFAQNGEMKLLKEKVSKMPELDAPLLPADTPALTGKIYAFAPDELPSEKEPMDLLGQRFLPLIRSGFQDRTNLAGLRSTAPFPFTGITGAYNQFAGRQGLDFKTVNRSGWLAWYHGKLTPPRPGRYRFWGYADNNLLVSVDGKPVFEGSRYDSAFRESIDVPRQNHPAWPCLNAQAGFASGPWFDVEDGPVPFDVLFGERRGMLTYGLLLIEREGDPYEKTFWGQPQYPLFLTHEPTASHRAALEQLRSYLEEKLLGSFSIAERATWSPSGSL